MQCKLGGRRNKEVDDGWCAMGADASPINWLLVSGATKGGLERSARKARAPSCSVRNGSKEDRRDEATDSRRQFAMSVAPRFATQDTRSRDQPGVGRPVLQPAISMEKAGSPKFPGNPCDHSPLFSDPGVTRQALWVQV
jgi:hypothetical protein